MRTLLVTLHSKYIHASLALPSLAAYCGTACGELLIREFTVLEPREAVLAALLRGGAGRGGVLGLPVEPPRDPRPGRCPGRRPPRPAPGGRRTRGLLRWGATCSLRHPGTDRPGARRRGTARCTALLSAWAAGGEPVGVARAALAPGSSAGRGAGRPAAGGARRHPLPLPGRAGRPRPRAGLPGDQPRLPVPLRLLPERPRPSRCAPSPWSGSLPTCNG